MREIIFRGKCILNGEWLYGDLLSDYYYGGILIIQKYTKTIESYLNNVSKFRVDPDTVGQYTGQRDGAGNWIFEGDIIRTESNYEAFYEDHEDLEEYEGIVRFGNYASRGDTGRFNKGYYVETEAAPVDDGHPRLELPYWVSIKFARVVGNIHDKETHNDQV